MVFKKQSKADLVPNDCLDDSTELGRILGNKYAQSQKIIHGNQRKQVKEHVFLLKTHKEI